ncbi:ABC transporter ATP-binding protein [Rubrimonas sp.]|uniref:ABC transporter ATP-binding protein n=1 Tax=Rubrimonas sp. TaxID=2036015 RepID=UPI002FDCD66E
MSLLEVEGLKAGYGPAQALHGVDLALAEGEALALMGRNGMGKTTTLGAIMGLATRMGGAVRLAGRDITRLPPHRIARLGVGLAPEGRRIFPALTVEENLRAAARPGPWSLPRLYALFPRLAERQRNMGGQLSGGEQQMLAIGRALATNPRLLLLDEATEGLAPVIRAEIWAQLAAIKAEGQSIVVVDKDLAALARLAERHVVLETGRVAWRGDGAALRAEAGRVAKLLTV